MINFNELNKHFDALRVKPCPLSQSEIVTLMAEEKIYGTIGWFYDWQMTEMVGPAPECYPYSFHHRQCGYVFANNLQEAQAAVDLRGWGEEIDGILVDVIPSDETVYFAKPNLN